MPILKVFRLKVYNVFSSVQYFLVRFFQTFSGKTLENPINYPPQIHPNKKRIENYGPPRAGHPFWGYNVLRIAFPKLVFVLYKTRSQHMTVITGSENSLSIGPWDSIFGPFEDFKDAKSFLQKNSFIENEFGTWTREDKKNAYFSVQVILSRSTLLILN